MAENDGCLIQNGGGTIGTPINDTIRLDNGHGDSPPSVHNLVTLH